MKKIFKIFPVSFFLILFLFSEHIQSKEIYVVCDEPKGQRIDYETRGKNWKNIDDGFSNSFPTFVYKSDNPEVLNTHWPAGNPLNLDPDEIEKIVSGQATEKILTINDDLIESIQTGGTNTWITRLYPKKGIGVFLRHGYYLDESLYFGAVYKSNCDFKTIDETSNNLKSSNDSLNLEETELNNVSVVTSVINIDKNDASICQIRNMTLAEDDKGVQMAGFLELFFVYSEKAEVFNEEPGYLIAISSSLSNISKDNNNELEYDVLTGYSTIQIGDGFFDFNDYEIESSEGVDDETYRRIVPYMRSLFFNENNKKIVAQFGQAMNIALQISSGLQDINVNYWTPDPVLRDQNQNVKNAGVYDIKLEFQKEKIEEVSACLMKAYVSGFSYLTELNNSN